MMNSTEQPLVSILVVTYNSRKYLQETLDSTAIQTYENIELIVSDDCSTDDTIEIATRWIGLNHKRFVRTLLLTSDVNTGVTGNCNRAFKAAEGEFLKYIAGDDILKNDCIANNVKYAISSQVEIVFSKIELIDQDSQRGEEFMKMESRMNNYSQEFCALSSLDQFKYQIFGSYVCSPTIFIRSDFLKRTNGFDPEFFIEDYPFLLKISSKGHRLNFLPIVTVSYRLHSESLTNKGNDGIFNKRFIDIYPDIINKYVSRAFFLKHPAIYIHFILFSLVRKLTVLTGNTMKQYKMFKLVFVASPFYIIQKLKSCFTKEVFFLYH